ncbi:MAG: DUF4097 family beta strand repeat protein [Acutalibacter sp.]|nr:DUF4097 family beta strand repeat protein [Acutalibacter sp.]
MSEGKEKILQMLEAEIITEEDAKRLLEALGETPDALQRAETFREETDRLCREAEEFRQQAEADVQAAQGNANVPSLTLYPDGMEEIVDGNVFEISASPTPPTPPTPPAPPAPPVPSVFEEDETETGEIVTESMDGRYPEIAKELCSLRVRWISGSVQVYGGESEELIIRETASRPLSEGEKTILSFGSGRLTVKWGKSPKWRPFQRPLEKHLEIVLPKSIDLESLDIGSISAPVSLRVITGGRLHASAVSGGISAEKLQGDQINLSTVSGGIEGRGLTADRLELHTVSGRLTGDFSAETAKLSTTSGTLTAQGNVWENLTLSTVSGVLRFEGTTGENFQVSTTSGSQHLALGGMPRTINCGSVSGKIDLRLPDSQGGFSAKYSTLSGSFGCEFPATGKQEKRSGSALYGQGNTKIEFSTTSGSMYIGRLS